MDYGLPYKGSKRKLAQGIIDLLPKANNFYDLFCGGCAVTQAAMKSHKYDKIVFNDIVGMIPQLFLDAINGKYKDEQRWIGRDDFFALKDTDAYVAVCWSFGNNLKGYLYGKDVEPLKRAAHYAIFFNDFEPSKDLGLDFSFCSNYLSKHDKKIAIKRYLKQLKEERFDLESLERLQSLERLERLQSLESLELKIGDYRNVQILPNSVIYCDIPYINTATYKTDFNHNKFYEWALNQTEPLFISSYQMPSDFICIKEWSHRSTLSATANNTVVERLFIPKHQEFKEHNLFSNIC